jgi:hypothetical protein
MLRKTNLEGFIQNFCTQVPLQHVKWQETGMISQGHFDVHFKLLNGEAIYAILVGRSTPEWPDWIADNVFSCKESMDMIQDIAGAFCKGGDITRALIEKRFCFPVPRCGAFPLESPKETAILSSLLQILSSHRADSAFSRAHSTRSC